MIIDNKQIKEMMIKIKQMRTVSKVDLYKKHDIVFRNQTEEFVITFEDKGLRDAAFEVLLSGEYREKSV